MKDKTIGLGLDALGGWCEDTSVCVFRLCQRDLAVKLKSDLDGVPSFDSILVELSTPGVGKVLFCKLNSAYLSKKLGHGEYTGGRVVIKEMTIKGKIIPSILLDIIFFITTCNVCLF